MVDEERKISRTDFFRFTASVIGTSVLQALSPKESRADEEKQKQSGQLVKPPEESTTPDIKRIPHFDKILYRPPDQDLLQPKINLEALIGKKPEIAGYYPPELKDYLVGFPLESFNHWTNGLTVVGDQLYFFSRTGGNLTNCNIRQISSKENWLAPLPDRPGWFLFCDIMTAPAYLSKNKVVCPTLILDFSNKKSPNIACFPVYTVADFGSREVRILEGRQVCWQTPAVIEEGRRIVVVGNQFNAARPPTSPQGAGIEFIDMENGKSEVIYFAPGEYLPDGVGFQVGHLLTGSGTQIGMPLRGHYSVFDLSGARRDLEHIDRPQRTILADVDRDGLHEIISGHSERNGMVRIASANSSEVREFPLWEERSANDSWGVTSLTAFQAGKEMFIFASAVTDFFRKSRLTVICSHGQGLERTILKDSQGNDLPVGYGLAGLVLDEKRIILVSPGYEILTNQRRLAVMLYDKEENRAEVIKIFKLGTWSDGLTSLGRPTVVRLSKDEVAVFSQLNLNMTPLNWVVGFSLNLARFHIQPNLPIGTQSWSQAVAANYRYPNALPL